MGFFSNMNAIRKINVLIKQLEPKLDYIASELQYPHSVNKQRLRMECGTVSVLMTEISDILENAGQSVFTATYFFKGRKITIMDLHELAASLVQEAGRLL